MTPGPGERNVEGQGQQQCKQLIGEGATNVWTLPGNESGKKKSKY
jgi:hypothetical protein